MRREIFWFKAAWLVGFLLVLTAILSGPVEAHHKEGHANGPKSNAVEQTEDNKTRGRSPSRPDQDGTGGDHGIVNDDKIEDGNNGCGNDSDREDDNNGKCGGVSPTNPPRQLPPSPTPTASVQPNPTPTPVGTTPVAVPPATPTESPEATPTIRGDAVGADLPRTGANPILATALGLVLILVGGAIVVAGRR